MHPAIQLIQEGYNLIKDPKHWCQGCYQKNKYGENTWMGNGYSFCALGVLHHLNYQSDNNERFVLDILGQKHTWSSLFLAQCLLQRFSEKLYKGKSIQDINDNETDAHNKVLKVYETIIEEFKNKDPLPQDYLRPEQNNQK